MPFNIKSSGSYYATFDDSILSANRIYRLPNESGTLLTTNGTASLALTASYVLNAVSASFATTASYVLGGGGGGVTIGGPTSTDWSQYAGTPNRYMLVSDGVTNDITASHILQLDTSNESINIYAGIEGYNGASISLGTDAYVQTGYFYGNRTSFFTSVEEKELTVVIGGTPTSLSLDLSKANIFEVSYNASVNTFSITNSPSTNYAGSFTLVTTGTGTPYPWNWGSAVTWSGGSAPSVTSTNGKKDIYGFITTNQGTNWYGFVGAQNV